MNPTEMAISAIITIVISTLSFLTGALWSSNKWMQSFGGRMTKLETEVENDRKNAVTEKEDVKETLHSLFELIKSVADTVKGLKIDVPPCSFHVALDKQVGELTVKVEHLEQQQNPK